MPRIRIEKIQLENFKGVKRGEVEFNCHKTSKKAYTDSDMLGIYGQNGSGKTTLLEALQLICKLMSGESLSYQNYANVISQGCDIAKVSIMFQVGGDDDDLYHVQYDFELSQEIQNIDGSVHSKKVTSELFNKIGATTVATAIAAGPTVMTGAAIAEALLRKNAVDKRKTKNGTEAKILVIKNEKISLSGNFDGTGKNIRFGAIFDAGTEDEVFLPKTKQKEFFPYETKIALRELDRYKNRIRYKAKSFVFSDEMSQMLLEQLSKKPGEGHAYIELLLMLKAYALDNLKVVGDTKKTVIPIFTPSKGLEIRKSDSSSILEKRDLEALKVTIDALNYVLEHLIPGMSLVLDKQTNKTIIGKDKIRKSNDYTKVVLSSVKGDVKVPLSDESAGIQRLVSILGLFSYAFVNRNVTIAIDEMDAGIYEYLLGELLTIFEEYGQGQLIFTCHNLRPLEVINKNSVCFTTTNEENRYIRPKNVRYDNNLRDVYLREIVHGGQEEELYSSAKYGKIVAALQKAGDIIAKE